MVNGLIDFKVYDRIVPYLGAGLGLAFPDFEGAKFAYQALAGVAFNVNPTTDFTIGYRYQVIDYDELDLHMHNAELGFRVSF